MKRTAIVALALGIATAPAFAAPTKMSDEQLDQVAGGLADVSVTVGDITVNPNIQVSVLGGL